MIYKFVFNLL